MAKQINKRLVGILTAVAMLVILGAGVAVMQALPQRDPEAIAKQARMYWERGKGKDAMEALLRAYTYDKNKDPKYLLEAANIAYAEGEWAQSYKLCQQVLTSGPNPAAQKLVLELLLQSALAAPIEQRWSEIAEEVAKVLPTEPAELAEFEKENVELAVQARLARGESSLARSGNDPKIIDDAVSDLRRIVYPDPAGGLQPLDPTHIHAAKRLRDVWILRAAIAMQGDDRADAEENLKNAAGVVQSVLAASETSEDEKIRTRAQLIRLVQNAPTVLSKSDVKLPPPLLTARRDHPDKEQVKAILSEVEAILEKAVLTFKEPELRGKRGEDFVESMISLSDFWSWMDDHKRAETVAKRAKDLRAEDLRPYERLAAIYESQKQYDDQARELMQAIETVKPVPGARGLLVRQRRPLLFDRMVQLEIQRNRASTDQAKIDAALARILDLYEKIKTELGEDNPVVRLIHARWLHQKGEYPPAIRELEDAVNGPATAGPGVVYEIHLLLADMYLRRGLFGQAEESVKQMRAARPNDPRAIVDLARIQIQQGRPQAALDNLNLLLEPRGSEPGLLAHVPDVRALRAEAYRRLGMLDLAERELAAARGPETKTVDLLRDAVLDIDRGLEQQAETKIRTVLESEPDNFQAMLYLLRVLANQDRAEEIKPFVDKALEKAPDDMRFKNLAISFNKDLTREQRAAEMAKLIESIADPFERAMTLYNFHRDSNRFDEAHAALQEAAKIKPDAQSVIDAQFTLALQKASAAARAGQPADWAAAEAIADRVAEMNDGRGMDEAGGRMYRGQIALQQGETTPTTDAETRRAHLERAVTFLEQGLQQFPSNAGGWVRLAEAYIGLNRDSDARVALQRAIKMQPNNGVAHWLMAMTCQRQGDGEGVRRHVIEAYKDRRLRLNPTVQRAYEMIREEEQPLVGIERREKIAAEKPQDIDNLVSLARLYEKANKLEDAVRTTQKALEIKPNDPPLTYGLARLYALRGDPEAGADLLNDLLERVDDLSEKAGIAIKLAQLYAMSDMDDGLERAENLYGLAHKWHRSSETASALGEFFAGRGRLANAVTCFEEARTLADNAATQHILSREIVRFKLMMMDTEAAGKELDAFAAKYPDDSELLVFRGTLALLNDDVEGAKQIFTDHLFKYPDSAVAYWQRGQLYLLDRRPESLRQAIDDLQKAKAFASKPPGLPGVQHRLQLAQALSRAGQTADAVEELRETLDELMRSEASEQDVTRVAVAAVEQLLDLNPPRETEAEGILVTMSNRFAHEPSWLIRLGDFYRGRKDSDRAMQNYHRAALISPGLAGRAAAARSILRLLEATDDHRRIIEYLSAADQASLLEKSPAFRAELGAAQFRNGDADAGWRSLLTALEKAGAHALLFRTFALPVVRAVGSADLLSRTEQALQSEPDSLLLLRLRLVLLKDLKRGPAILEAGKQLQAKAAGPGDKTFALFETASAQHDEGRLEEAASDYEALLKIDPDNVSALNNLAFLLAQDLKRPDEGLSYAEKAARLSMGSAAILDTLGWCQALAGKFSEARRTLNRCLRIDNSFTEGRMHLGITLAREGKDLDLARQHLEAARQELLTQTNLSNADAERLAALVAEGKMDDARKINATLTTIEEALRGLPPGNAAAAAS